MTFYMAKEQWLVNYILKYKSQLIMPIALEFFQPITEIF
jgi:hypothetical protein